VISSYLCTSFRDGIEDVDEFSLRIIRRDADVEVLTQLEDGRVSGEFCQARYRVEVEEIDDVQGFTDSP